jgi:16S rRNA (cytosine1402-N4)-methyltransferase
LAAQYSDRLTLLRESFSAIDRVVGDSAADGVAFDLGVSSPQLDDAARGFSFRHDGPLDMRMSADGMSAAEFVNRAAEGELADTIATLGEERHARRVARAIVAARREHPITRTGELSEIVRGVVPRARDGIDPATRTFQALRMRVNEELDELDSGLGAAERALKPGGRLAVVSFHSLEDRAVKHFLRERSGTGIGTSRHVPEARRRAPSFRLLARKPIEPGPNELRRNARARSARLRIAERTEAPAWPAAST